MWEIVMFIASVVMLGVSILFFYDAHKRYDSVLNLIEGGYKGFFSGLVDDLKNAQKLIDLKNMQKKSAMDSNYVDPNPAKNLWYPLGSNK
jgi:hypothetical protein